MASEEQAKDDLEEPERPRAKTTSRLTLEIIAVFLVAIGASSCAWIALGFLDGWLLPTWNNLTDAQGGIIASLVTLYAAALAAIAGPLIFTGQIANMRGASERAIAMIDAQNQRMTEQLEHIRKMVRQTEEAVLLVDEGKPFDPEKALIRLEGIREDATALAQSMIEKSNKWNSTKDKMKRKWPGRRPYYRTMHNLGFISERQRDLFFAISDTRLVKAAEITEGVVEAAEMQLTELKSNGAAKAA